MNHKRVKLSTGVIDIFDGAVSHYERDNVFDFLISKCGWHIGWNDVKGGEPHLHAVLQDDNWYNLIENLAGNKVANERMRGLIGHLIIANLSTSSSIHHKHTHPNSDLVSLYYANEQWMDHWEGETVFYSEDGDIEYVNKYVPGRIMLFDAKMPHSIRAQSPAGPQFRFTISYFWKHDEN